MPDSVSKILTENGPAVVICAMFLYFLVHLGKTWRVSQAERDSGWQKAIADVSRQSADAIKEQGDRMERISNKGHEAAFELSKEISGLRSDLRKD